MLNGRRRAVDHRRNFVLSHVQQSALLSANGRVLAAIALTLRGDAGAFFGGVAFLTAAAIMVVAVRKLSQHLRRTLQVARKSRLVRRNSSSKAFHVHFPIPATCSSG